MAHSTYPKGAGNLGNLGDAVDVDFVMNHGSRAQRRRLERHLKREAAKAATPRKEGGKQ